MSYHRSNLYTRRHATINTVSSLRDQSSLHCSETLASRTAALALLCYSFPYYNYIEGDQKQAYFSAIATATTQRSPKATGWINNVNPL